MLQTTRRTVLSAAAWTVPVVTVATASPAFATSDPTAVTFSPGSTAVATDGDFFGVKLSGASLQIGADALTAPATLTMTVTFLPTAGDDEIYSEMTAPTGWRHEPRSAGVRNRLVFTYLADVTRGTMVPLEDDVYFGTDDVAQRGSFVLTFVVGGLSTQWSISTP